MVLEGEDFIDALDNAKLELERDSKEYDELDKAYTKLEKDYEELSKNLEILIKGKEGPFIDKIKNIIKEHKLG
jgi:hypothetical protein